MNRLDQVPAIVRQNQRSIQSLMDCCANGYRATVAQAETWLTNHAELRVRYKEKFSTWEAACEHVYGVTRQAVHKKLLKISDGVLDVSATLVAKEETAITQVEQARKEPDLSCVPVEVREAVVEHIHDAHKPVNSSTVKEASQVVPQRTARVENGKPKSQLAVWQELRDAYGRANNQLPEANRVWPAEEFQYLKDLTHKCFAAVERWHGKVR